MAAIAAAPGKRRIARFFVELQTRRHSADCDLAATFTRNEALEFIRFARGAFEDWAVIRTSDAADVFLRSLTFAKRWAK